MSSDTRPTFDPIVFDKVVCARVCVYVCVCVVLCLFHAKISFRRLPDFRLILLAKYSAFRQFVGHVGGWGLGGDRSLSLLRHGVVQYIY
jgi:hypothetical protein